MAQSQKLPIRLHHNAYVTRDQEKTRQFYEESSACRWWRPGASRTSCSARCAPTAIPSTRMADGGALAFFQFENPERPGGIRTEDAGVTVSSHRAAVDAETQAAIEQRIAAAGIKPPDTYVLEHGYCRSVYVNDPNGLILEFTLDHPKADKISRDRRADAHQELKRWLAGNHTSNNTYR